MCLLAGSCDPLYYVCIYPWFLLGGDSLGELAPVQVRKHHMFLNPCECERIKLSHPASLHHHVLEGKGHSAL